MGSPTAFYRVLVPLLKCEVPDMRDSVVQALGRINHMAIMDLMSEVSLRRLSNKGDCLRRLALFSNG